MLAGNLMEASNLMDDATRRRCTAMSKRSGARCKRAPAIGRTVCAMHGGKSPVGPASPHWVDGRFSRVLPARLLALHDEIALVDARIADVLQRVESGESSRIWRELAAVEREAAAALRRGDGAAAAGALARLRALIAGGRGDWAAWADVLLLIRERKALVEAERRRLVVAQRVIAVEDAMAVLGLLVEAVRRHVRDEATLRAVTDEYTRLVGQPT